ncbi:MAG: LysR substrate-binding domain-containing protein [Pikeienuella sp.]
MSEITLKQLRYFEAVASAGHFGRAADACSISQPAISLQIKELEETLGIALFDRGGRQIRLTSFGEDLIERTRSILRSVDDLGDFTRTAQDSFVGRLRLGVIPTIAPYLLPKVIAQLADSYADLDLNIRETQTEKLIVDLIDGRLDTAIVALPISEPSLHEKPLFDEKFVLVRSMGDAALPIPSRAGLREMKLLLLEEGHCFRDQALSFCNLQPVTPRETMEGSSLSTLVQMVGAGIGVTLIPEMAVGVETKSADVSVARFPDPQPSRTIGMVWRRSSPLDKQLRKIAGVVGQSVQF